MKELVVTQALTSAWEVWAIEVPDDFPSDATQDEQIAWINDNPDLVDGWVLKDSGADCYEIVEVEPR